MTYNADWDEFLTTTVTYAVPSTMTAYGAQSYGTTYTIPARIEHFTRFVTDVAGNEVVSNTRLFLRPTSSTGGSFTPTVAGLLTLPAGNEPLKPPIINVRGVNDVMSEGGGISHWEVSL